ncbi:L-aspartate oxidase [Pontibacter ruber]|uniref:L-aspartate oxidase n=1 Tax=Pontibacter ruber TaxID=1343895 RepID=A0ABW5CSS6_9BACT|nr:L-aspartate oxidase [Pontibacter ruber]
MTLKYDFVVLGSGIAGLTFALHAATYGTVAVVCKAGATETNTAYAQGGIAAVLGAYDSFEQHVQDTLTAGAGLCNEAAVRYMVEQAPQAIGWLQAQGVLFDKSDSRQLALGLEGGHSRHRIAHVKDHTGLSIQQVLVQAARHQPNITLLEHHLGIDLLTENQVCYGVEVLDLKNGAIKTILAGAVALATGGSGRVYQHTTNPAIATGDGLAMACRADAEVTNMEFFQFHPTALYEPGAKDTFLVSEALRGAGAELVLPDGNRFMHRHHPLGSLAPRDVVARAVYEQMQLLNSPCLYLDARHLPKGKVQKQFPFITTKCKSIGIDPVNDLIPVVPAAHYQCGGLQTDLHGQTSLARLYAIGEVACTGVHGANRLASNSLLEGVVFGKSAAVHAVRLPKGVSYLPDNQESITSESIPAAMRTAASIKQQLQHLMWEHAGIVRTVQGLQQAIRRVEALKQQLQPTHNLAPTCQGRIETKNLLTVAEIILKACLSRTESIGGHYMEQVPELTLSH